MGKRGRQGYIHIYRRLQSVHMLAPLKSHHHNYIWYHNTHLSFLNPIDTVKGSVHLQGLWHHQVVYGSMLLTYLLNLSVDISIPRHYKHVKTSFLNETGNLRVHTTSAFNAKVI